MIDLDAIPAWVYLLVWAVGVLAGLFIGGGLKATLMIGEHRR